MGDFNVIPEDFPHPFKTVILSPEWLNGVKAVNDSFWGLNRKDLRDLKAQMPSGTERFNDAWNTLDYIFASRNLMDGKGMHVEVDSFRVIAAPFASGVATLTTTEGDKAVTKRFYVPAGLDLKATAPGNIGASDHYPVVVKIKL